MAKSTRFNADERAADEIDTEFMELLGDYSDGTVSYDELKAMIGNEAAQSIRRRTAGSLDALFYDPEDF